MKKVRQDESNVMHRLRSIALDSDYVQMVSNAATNQDLPTFANLRCGRWYLPYFDGECYFKSTDGHYGVWSFNMSRLNLHLFMAAATHGGVVIVDSTRKGKVFPDSLSKTVPIVAMVLNCALGLREPTVDNGLPPWLPISERSAIVDLVRGWAKTFCESSVDTAELVSRLNSRPFQCVWVPRSEDRTQLEVNPGVIFLHLVSASNNMERHDTQQGRTAFSYVPGAGDDEEAWARGLTPALFWSHSDRFLAFNNCIDLIEEIDIAVGGALGPEETLHSSPEPVLLAPFRIFVVSVALNLDGPVIFCSAGKTPPSASGAMTIVARDGSKFDFERALPPLLEELEKVWVPGSHRLTIMANEYPALAQALAIVLTLRYCCDVASRSSKTAVSDIYAQVAAQLPWIRGCRNLRKQINRYFLT